MMETGDFDCTGLPRLPVRRAIIMPSGAVFYEDVGIAILEVLAAKERAGREAVSVKGGAA